MLFFGGLSYIFASIDFSYTLISPSNFGLLLLQFFGAGASLGEFLFVYRTLAVRQVAGAGAQVPVNWRGVK